MTKPDISPEAVERAIGMCRLHGLHGTEATLRAISEALQAAEAENARLREALNHIDALDPEDAIYGCSADASRGLVIRMGQIARAALQETKP